MKRMLFIAILVGVITSLVTISPNKAAACSCYAPSIEENFELSSAVFTGTLVSRDAEGGNIFRMDKVWKGELVDGYVYSGFYGMCGTEFVEGATYLVYTENLKDRQTTGLCSGNKLITEASEDIQVLNRITEASENIQAPNPDIGPEWNMKYLLVLLGIVMAFVIVMIIRAKSRRGK